jgi:uncharacterized membrane protein
MVDNATVHVEDLVPVRSRISWGAIFAGATVSLALYFLLTLLGGAIGLSVSGRVRAETLTTGAAVWAVLVTVLALFVGGYVASQCSVGENRFESILYGVILWGVMFAALLWLSASGVRAGFNAMLGMSYATQATDADWKSTAREAGVSQAKIDDWSKDATEAVKDRDNQQKAADAVTRVTWWAFLATLVSMVAAVAGSYAGAGPRFRLVRVPYLRTRGEVGDRRPVGSTY